MSDSDAAGTTAQIVLSPLGDSTFYDSAEAQAALAAVQAEAARLPTIDIEGESGLRAPEMERVAPVSESRDQTLV